MKNTILILLLSAASIFAQGTRPPDQSGILFKDKGTSLGRRGSVSTLNFTGNGVTATRNGSVVTVAITAGSGGAAFSDSLGLRALISDESGTGVAIFDYAPDPVFLRAPRAMSGSAWDVTTEEGTRALTGNATLTLSAAPATGQRWGATFTADGTPRVITLPAGTWQSEARGGAAVTTITIPANYAAWVGARSIGSGIFRLYGEPVLAGDITTKATPVNGDFLLMADTSAGGLDKKTAVSNFVLAGTGVPVLLQQADSAAANNTIYWSTTQNTLVHKDPQGTPRAIY